MNKDIINYFTIHLKTNIHTYKKNLHTAIGVRAGIDTFQGNFSTLSRLSDLFSICIFFQNDQETMKLFINIYQCVYVNIIFSKQHIN